MTYKEFITNILTTRGRFGIPKEEYKERHHIIPRCLGGTDDEENLIDLYAREHYEAHKLLYKENKNNLSLSFAFILMSNIRKGNYTISAEEYEEARKALSESASKNNTGKKLYTNGKIYTFKRECPVGFWKESRKELSIKNGSRGYETLNDVLNRINMDEFREYIKNHSNKEIQIEFNLTNKMVKKLMKLFPDSKRDKGKLRSNKLKENIKLIDKDKLIGDWNNGMSLSDISNKYSLSYNSLLKLRKKYNITGNRYKLQSGKNHFRSIKLYCVELDKVYNSITEAARETGVNHNTLKTHYRKNKKINNLTFIKYLEVE